MTTRLRAARSRETTHAGIPRRRERRRHRAQKGLREARATGMALPDPLRLLVDRDQGAAPLDGRDALREIGGAGETGRRRLDGGRAVPSRRLRLRARTGGRHVTSAGHGAGGPIVGQEAVEQMARYGITRVPADHFFYEGYRYTSLDDAIAQAKRRHLAVPQDGRERSGSR